MLGAISTRVIFKKKLQLGSGLKRDPDATNVDIVASTNPDLCHDLNVVPWPLPSNTFTECTGHDVIEHLDDVVKTMEEVYRVCRPGAVVRITVPHFSCANAFRDPTHRHYFSRFSLEYFTDSHQFAFYSRARFHERAARIIFRRSLLNRIVQRIANRFPEAYEQRWAWMFPAWFLYFELEVMK